jgi:hypothetical protein
MALNVGSVVMLPGYQPYPRYGRVAQLLDDGRVLVTQVQCGDPRCAAEHVHADVTWHASDLEGQEAYQGRAGWEAGRKSSPNATVA